MKMVKVTGLVLLTGVAGLAAYVIVWWFLTSLNAYFE